jgi:D-alanyl-D-alanine dipeptidase
MPAASRPIPNAGGARTALDYSDVPVDLSAPAAAEPLVDLPVASEAYYARRDGLNPPYYHAFASAPARLLCRAGVARRLAAADAAVRPLGIELYVLDAFRPVACQRELWTHFLNEARRVLPGATPAEHVRHAGRYCSDPSSFDARDPRTWPTHCTGGAVDLTLRRRGTGEPLFMGSVFDDPAEISHTAHFDPGGPAATLDSASAHEARRNRRILYWAMHDAGFANYPFEWWHFDWGTQMWVMNGGGPGPAVYGPAAEPGGSVV